jgi:hypothetical protein
MMLRRAILILIGSLLFFNVTFSNAQDKDNEYFENMITIWVGRYLKVEFYEVISDYDGDIYIDIKDFLELTELNEYTKFSIEDGKINLTMDSSLFADKMERHIIKEIKKLKSVKINEKLYIKKESLGDLLPLKKIAWIEEKYTLEIFPDFSLPLDFRVNAERRKRSVEESKANKNSSSEVDIFMKDDRKIIDLGMLRVRYDIDDVGNFFKEGEKKDKGDIEAEYSSQLLYGDFNMRHNLYSTRELEDISLKYPYFFKNKTVTIGDSYIAGNDILGYNSKIRGISISENSYNVKRSGREITINGEASKNSLVEVYQNGKIADYQNIDGKDYEFILDMRTQNDEFKIKFYDRNGVLVEERNLNIMGGNNFLTKGDWDYDFFYGQNPNGENNDWDDLKYGISHGFTNNLTYSLDYYDTKDEEKLYRYLKHRTGYRFSNLPIPLVINLSYYDSLEDESKGYIAGVKTEIFSHKLYYTYEHYKNILATDQEKNYYHEAEISGDYKRSDYFFRFSNKTYMKSVVEKYDIGLSYNITKNLRVNMDLGKTIKKDDERKTNYTRKIGLDYGRNGFTYSLDSRYDKGSNPNWKYTGSIRRRLGKDRKYSYNMDVKYDENDSFTFGFGFDYKFNDFFKINYDYSSERNDMNKIKASFEKVVNLKNPLAPNTAKDPDKGYIDGIIFIDTNGNEKKDADEHPLSGIGARIGSNKVKTNKDGVFHLTNISPYRKNKLVYDYSDIIIDPTLRADNFQEIQIIPASGKIANVGLVPMSMIMGSIYLPDIDNKKINKFFSYTEIIIEKNGKYYDSIIPEYDGFFVVQDLKPGKYSLKINYLGSEKISLEKDVLEVVVKGGQTGDFYDEIDFKVLEIKKVLPKLIQISR